MVDMRLKLHCPNIASPRQVPDVRQTPVHFFAECPDTPCIACNGFPNALKARSVQPQSAPHRPFRISSLKKKKLSESSGALCGACTGPGAAFRGYRNFQKSRAFSRCCLKSAAVASVVLACAHWKHSNANLKNMHVAPRFGAGPAGRVCAIGSSR